MSIQKTSGGLDDLLSLVLKQRQQAAAVSNPTLKKAEKVQGQDIVTLSAKQQGGHAPFNQKQSKLISENIENTGNGVRRTQEFENAAGKKFIRIEDFSTSQNRSKRIVIQQNNSGNTTTLENILDRQEDGSFRLIQRYTDEAGVTKTNVTPDFKPINADILLGRPPAQNIQPDSPFQNLRGTQINLSV